MDEWAKGLLPRRRPGALRLLDISGWVLLGVAWTMSVYAYGRLPEEMVLWKSLLVKNILRVEKSLLFFVFPLAQTIFFFVVRALARAFFFRAHDLGQEVGAAGQDKEIGLRLLDLKKETVFLVLIFSSLIFIHLQTSLILLSHRLVSGINPFYLAMLLAILLILIPYYAVRRKMLLRTL
ncbi:MAG: hypothetical protein ACUVV5_07440 [Candidatus Aminicenantales bacterium]